MYPKSPTFTKITKIQKLLQQQLWVKQYFLLHFYIDLLIEVYLNMRKFIFFVVHLMNKTNGYHLDLLQEILKI